jgi:flagellar biosynthesis anti-sigma factor FlgM
MNIRKIPPYLTDVMQNSGATGKPGGQEKAVAGNAVTSDRVHLSKDYQSLANAQKVITGSEDVRNDKVQQIKLQLDGGNYQIKPYEIAGKMLDEVI